MRYLLDTDRISFLQRRAAPEYGRLTARMALHPPTEFAFSVVSFHEQVMGAHARINQARHTAGVSRRYELLLDILQTFMAAPVLPFDAAAGAVFDGLVSQRLRLPTMDLRIAAIAFSRGLILLTRNVRDFGRVPGLVTEDWTL